MIEGDSTEAVQAILDVFLHGAETIQNVIWSHRPKHRLTTTRKLTFRKFWIGPNLVQKYLADFHPGHERNWHFTYIA